MDRIATADDENNYSNAYVGNYIIDSVDKNGMVNYYFAKDQLVAKGFTGGKILFDTEKLKGNPKIRFQHSSDQSVPWSDTIRLETLDYKKLKTSNISVCGVKDTELSRNFIIDGGSIGACLLVNPQDGGSVTVEGFDSTGGSQGIRIGTLFKSYKFKSIDIQNFKIRDTSWEGFYLGMTKEIFPYIENVTIKNGVIIRPGAEGWQGQHLLGGLIQDVTIIDGGNNYLGGVIDGPPSQNFQDCGMQIVLDGGKLLLDNILIQGWANNGITIDGGGEGQVVDIRNMLFTDGKGVPMYIHNRYKGKVKLFNCVNTRQNYEYFKRSATPVINAKIHGNTSNVDGTIETVVSSQLRYRNGYTNVTRWAAVYPKWFTNVAGQPVVFSMNDKVIHGRKFYRVAVNYTTAEPGASPDWIEIDGLSDDYSINPFMGRI